MLLETFPTMEPPAPAPSAVDCRVYERRSCDLPTTCHPASLLAMKEAGWSAIIRDISEGGVRIDASRRFEKNTALAIELPGDESGDPSVVFVKVVHLKRLEDGGWALGCKFIHEMGEAELDRLLSLGHPPFRDRLQAPQPDEAAAPAETADVPALVEPPVVVEAPVLVEERILSNVHIDIAIQRGWKISCHLARFKATKVWPLVPGKIIHLNVSGKDQPASPLTIQLVECHQEADGWRFDAKLARTPNLPDLLRALGSCG